MDVKIKIFKRGFNYSQDGPGNRLVYHLQGCNLHCPWCANPESMDMAGTYVADKNMGIRCSCEELPVEAVLHEVKRSASMFFDGGGVTFTGGEPTLQFEALKMLLSSLKDEGIHTAIETNATHTKLELLFPFIDFLIMDFKHYNSDIHKQVTGLGNEIIRANIKKALETHKNVLIRIPLIKGFNSAKEDAKSFVEFFCRQDASRAAFEFLPYHEFGKVKWLKCGMEYIMEDGFIEQGVLELFEKTFRENKLQVIRT